MAKVIRTEFLINCHATPHVPEGMTIKKHILAEPVIWLRDQPFHLYLSDGQKHNLLCGHKLRREVRQLSSMNACGWMFFSTHQHLIPAGIREMCLYFWGTIFLDACGREHVPCLYRENRWHRGTRQLDDLFGEEDVAVLYPQLQAA
jgi:hypothetical protein